MGEHNNAHLIYVAMTSRLRDTPLSVLILSSSGAGKTALQDAVLAFCPPEDLVKLTALSGKALFYKERLSLEAQGAGPGRRRRRGGSDVRHSQPHQRRGTGQRKHDQRPGHRPTHDDGKQGGRPEFRLLHHDPAGRGPGNEKPVLGHHDRREPRDQTRKILSFQRQQHLSDGLITSPEIEAILRKHRNFQRLLKPLAVKNPYAAQLTYGDDRLQGRRDQPKYLNLIKAIAFLRQMQKEVFHEQRNGVAVPYIKADLDDIALANRLAHEILGHSLDELSRPGNDLLLLLEDMAQERVKALLKENPDSKLKPAALSFSRRDIREFTGWSNTRLHVHLKELVDFEYIVIETGRNGMPFRYRLAWEGQGKDGRRFMLGLADPEKLRDPSPGDEAK